MPVKDSVDLEVWIKPHAQSKLFEEKNMGRETCSRYTHHARKVE
jgi:hypothetical protein